MTLNIAFIGFGEVGQLFARELAAKPGVAVAVYDRKFADPVSRGAMAETARNMSVRFAATYAEACAGANLVISAVTADQAVEVAKSAAPHLAAHQIYVDLNSISPTTKGAAAEAMAASGAAFVEFAVMSPVAGLGIESPILAGGGQAEALAARLNALGMKIKAVGVEIGVASATKLCRSIVIKGLEAIMIDMGLASEKVGVKQAVLASLEASYPGMPWADVVDYMPPRVARHGVRRAAEMREAARMLREMGLNGDFSDAIAARHESFATK